MSHFSVIVVTDARPDMDALQETLLPWHEYECTGIERYVEWVDHTDEVAAEYAGEHVAKYPTLAAFATGYHGYTVRDDGRIGRRTNPNRKWDWWQVGGRYSGKLFVKAGALAFAGERSWTNKAATIPGFDQAQRSELDLDAMKSALAAQRRRWADDCCARAGLTIADLDVACRVAPVVHAEWMKLAEPKPRGGAFADWAEAHGGEWPVFAAFQSVCFEIPEPRENQSLMDWIADAPPLECWAVVMDNQWFEKGRMGWFGASSGDKHNWDHLTAELFDLVRPDQWLTIVDCHI